MNRSPPLLARAVLPGLGGIVLLWMAASISWPFGWDHGVFAWVGDTIVRGGMPYQDAFDVKGPMSFYPSALVQAVLGRNWWGIRLLDLCLVVPTAILIGRVTARFVGRRIGAAAALLWILAYANTGFMNTAQPDGWFTWLILFALSPLLLSDRPITALHLGLAGLAVGVAALLKPFYLLYLLVPAAAAWRERRSTSGRVGAAAVMAMAAAAPIVVMIAWFGARGALDAFAEVYVQFNVDKNSVGLSDQADEALSYGLLADPVMLLSLPVAIAGLTALIRRAPRAALVLGLWAALSLILVLVQRPYYPYRLHAVSPVLAMLGGIGVASVAALSAALLVVATLVLARHPVGDTIRWLQFVSGSLPRAAYYTPYTTWRSTAHDEARVAAHLRETTAPSDAVFAWNHPSIVVMAQRPAANRLMTEVPMSWHLPEPLRARYLRELRAALAAERPAIIVTEVSAGLFHLPGGPGDEISSLYQLEFHSGALRVYRRLGEP